MSKKKEAFRGIRKTANILRRAFAKAAVLSGRIENKADRIIHGTDPTVQIHDTVLLEQVLSEALPEIVPIYPALPRADAAPTVTILIPSLQKSSFFGGTATALITAALIAKNKSLPLRIVETIVHGKAKTADVESFLASANIGWGDSPVTLENLAGRKYNHYGYLNMHPEDIYIASAWWDAHLLSRLPLRRKFIYLIQDFEPIFYNNSDKYALAEATYHSDKFIALCNTKLMYDFMLSRGYNKVKNGAYFEPAVSRVSGLESRPKVASGKKRLFLYGRPGVSRNLYGLALSSIDYAFANNYLATKDWEVVMAGQDTLPNIHLTSGPIIKNLGKMDMDGYIKLLKTVDVALSPMMAPHPNYPTLEFASAGAAVVTTKYDIKQDLSNYSSNIVMSDISIESMAGAIKTAANISNADKQKNTGSTNVGSDWLSALNEPISNTLKAIN